MQAPKVLFSMIGVLIVFAVVTYLLSGSLSGTIIKTVIAAVLLQVGYFVATLVLVLKEARARRAVASREAAQSVATDKARDPVGSPGLGDNGHTALHNR